MSTRAPRPLRVRDRRLDSDAVKRLARLTRERGIKAVCKLARISESSLDIALSGGRLSEHTAARIEFWLGKLDAPAPTEPQDPEAA